MLSSFPVFWGDLVGLQASSVDQACSAINTFHRQNGVSGVLEGRPRVTLIRKAIRRRDKGHEKRKAPVPPEVVSEVVRTATRDARRAGAGIKKSSKLLGLAAATAVAWAFMLRRSEFLYSAEFDRRGWGLRLEDIALHPKSADRPARLEITVRGSQTDEEGLGVKRGRWAFDASSVNPAACPVVATASWVASLRPDMDRKAFGFRDITAKELQSSLQDADARLRIMGGLCLPPRSGEGAGFSRLTTHSLQAGGA